MGNIACSPYSPARDSPSTKVVMLEELLADDSRAPDDRSEKYPAKAGAALRDGP